MSVARAPYAAAAASPSAGPDPVTTGSALRPAGGLTAETTAAAAAAEIEYIGQRYFELVASISPVAEQVQ